MIGGQLQRFAKARKDMLVAVNNLGIAVGFFKTSNIMRLSTFVNGHVRHMFDETDYILEGQNAEWFAAPYGCTPLGNIFERYCSTAASYWHQGSQNLLESDPQSCPYYGIA